MCPAVLDLLLGVVFWFLWCRLSIPLCRKNDEAAVALDSPEPLRKRRRFSCFSVGGNRDKCKDDRAIPRRMT